MCPLWAVAPGFLPPPFLRRGVPTLLVTEAGQHYGQHICRVEGGGGVCTADDSVANATAATMTSTAKSSKAVVATGTRAFRREMIAVASKLSFESIDDDQLKNEDDEEGDVDIDCSGFTSFRGTMSVSIGDKRAGASSKHSGLPRVLEDEGVEGVAATGGNKLVAFAAGSCGRQDIVEGGATAGCTCKCMVRTSRNFALSQAAVSLVGTSSGSVGNVVGGGTSKREQSYDVHSTTQTRAVSPMEDMPAAFEGLTTSDRRQLQAMDVRGALCKGAHTQRNTVANITAREPRVGEGSQAGACTCTLPPYASFAPASAGKTTVGVGDHSAATMQRTAWAEGGGATSGLGRDVWQVDSQEEQRQEIVQPIPASLTPKRYLLDCGGGDSNRPSSDAHPLSLIDESRDVRGKQSKMWEREVGHGTIPDLATVETVASPFEISPQQQSFDNLALAVKGSAEAFDSANSVAAPESVSQRLCLRTPVSRTALRAWRGGDGGDGGVVFNTGGVTTAANPAPRSLSGVGGSAGITFPVDLGSSVNKAAVEIFSVTTPRATGDCPARSLGVPEKTAAGGEAGNERPVGQSFTMSMLCPSSGMDSVAASNFDSLDDDFDALSTAHGLCCEGRKESVRCPPAAAADGNAASSSEPPSRTEPRASCVERQKGDGSSTHASSILDDVLLMQPFVSESIRSVANIASKSPSSLRGRSTVAPARKGSTSRASVDQEPDKEVLHVEEGCRDESEAVPGKLAGSRVWFPSKDERLVCNAAQIRSTRGNDTQVEGRTRSMPKVLKADLQRRHSGNADDKVRDSEDAQNSEEGSDSDSSEDEKFNSSVSMYWY